MLVFPEYEYMTWLAIDLQAFVRCRKSLFLGKRSSPGLGKQKLCIHVDTWTYTKPLNSSNFQTVMFMKPTRLFEVVTDLLIVTDTVPLVCGVVFV